MSPCSSDCIFQALRALSGVQSLRILDSEDVGPPHLSVATATVHGCSRCEKPAKASFGAMVSERQLPDDLSKRLDVCLLRREQRVRFEEWDDAFEKVVPFTDDIYDCAILQAIRPDSAATESIPDQLENLSPVTVLADMELRNKLKPEATRCVALNRHREASFSVDVTRDVTVQPFLLIVRTRHVVTTVNIRSDVTMSSAGYSEFPAYSQIYRQQWSTVSRRSEPSSRTALMGEQPNPWDLLQPQDATSRHRGAKPFRRCGLLGRISLLSPEYLLSVERRHFHLLPPDH